jgi:DNA-binding response OmpR family regulator
MRRLLLIEDNQSLSAGLSAKLQESFEVVPAATVAAARALFAKPSRFDLAVVDIFLPDGSGIDVAKEVLVPQAIPVVFLSAYSSAEYRLEALEAGGADFVPKPFHLRELVLRIERVLSSATTRASGATLRIEGVEIDFDARTVTFGDSHAVLSVRDAQLLKMLIDNEPRSISREELANAVWGDAGGAAGRTIDNGVVRLRHALGPAAGALRSVRGVGYQWSAAK